MLEIGYGSRPPHPPSASATKQWLLGMRHLVIMFAEQVLAKIVEQVTPYCVDVIGVVLGVVVFHQERGTLDSIVMTLARFEPSRPGEIDFLFTGLLNLLQ